MELAENKMYSAGEQGTQHETDCRETQNRKLNTNKNGDLSGETESSGRS